MKLSLGLLVIAVLLSGCRYVDSGSDGAPNQGILIAEFIANSDIDSRSREDAIYFLEDKQEPCVLIRALFLHDKIDGVSDTIVSAISEVGDNRHADLLREYAKNIEGEWLPGEFNANLHLTIDRLESKE